MPLKDILAALKDDQEIQIGENKVKVADVKGELAAYDKMVAREEYDKAVAEKDSLTNQVVEFMSKAANATVNTVDQQQNQQPPVDPRAAIREGLKDILFQKEGIDYNKDQYVGPAMQQAEQRAYARAVNDLTQRYDAPLKQITENQQKLYNAAVQAEEQSWYRMHRKELPKRPDGQEYSLNDLRQLGMRNSIYNDRQIVDYDVLLDRLTYPDREKKAREEAADKAYKKGIEDARKAQASQIVDFPFRQGIRVGEQKVIDTKGKSASQIMTEAIDGALNDPDLLNLQSA